MSKYLNPLSEQEVEQVVKAPALVTVLVAGADKNIDKKEKNWASRLVKYRTFTADVLLHDYYELVQDRFESDLLALTETWTSDQQDEIAAQLEALNEIFPKLDADFADHLKASLRSLARRVAEASGGILGFGSIDPNEKEVVDLPMIK